MGVSGRLEGEGDSKRVWSRLLDGKSNWQNFGELFESLRRL